MEKQMNTAIIILAAGLGTRMKSNKAKVLHELQGRPMIHYVTDLAVTVAGENVIVVTGHQAEQVKAAASQSGDLEFAYQAEQLGTGHAVMCAIPHVDDSIEEVVILCGDVPLLEGDTLFQLIQTHRGQGNDLTVLAVSMTDPTGYGRIVTDSNRVVQKIVEEADADIEEKTISVVNSGIYCVERSCLEESLKKITSDNAQKELYLTDIIEISKRDGRRIGLMVCDDPDQVVGVNSQQDLQRAEKILTSRQLKKS